MEKVKDSVTIIETVDFLNELVKLDPVAMNALFSMRIGCTKAMADHPTVQVGVLGKGYFTVGLIGILNGLFGADEHQWGHISADIDDGAVTGFRLLSTEDVAKYVAKGKEEND